jgi:hypothetical protein
MTEQAVSEQAVTDQEVTDQEVALAPVGGLIMVGEDDAGVDCADGFCAVL